MVQEGRGPEGRGQRGVWPPFRACLRGAWPGRGVARPLWELGFSQRTGEDLQFSSVQSLSRVRLCNPMNRSTPGLPVHHHRPEFTLSIESVMPSSHLILCRPLLLLPPIPPSIRGFSNKSTLRMRWPKYWSFSFSIIPSKEIPGLISFRMD